MLHFAKQMKTFTLGPFNPSINVFHWLEHILCKYLPPDAHQLANGRLAVAMTRLIDGKHIVMSEFQSKDDVVQVSFHYKTTLLIKSELDSCNCCILSSGSAM